MPYNRNQIPDAPLPVSMMPRVETPLKSDLLYLVQPGNNPGERSETALNWMGSDTFSVAEYCLSNQIFHYAEWVLRYVE